MIIRLKMTQSTNALPGELLCHHGVSDDVFPIGGLVEPDETLMGSAIRHCHHLVNYCVKPNDLMYSTKVLSDFMNHEPVKTSIYVTNVLNMDLKWRGRHSTRAMAIQVVDHLNLIEQSSEGQPGPLPPAAAPISLTIDTAYGDTDKFSIYQWDERAPLNKAHCLDFGDLVSTKDIEDNLGIDTDIVQMFWGDM